MHKATLDKQTVMHVLDEAVDTLQHDDDLALRASACDALGIGTTEWEKCRDELIEQLQEAGEWAEREQAIVESDVPRPPVDSEDGPEFLPSHPTLALLQSAMEEHIEEEEEEETEDERDDERPARRFHRRDPKWLSVLYHRLRARARGKADFILHERPDDFRFELAERATVALVSDWGTGNVEAAAVARQIASHHPDHVIHLGDVYYSGTPREMERNFLSMWRDYGPRGARYWALNANHDMYSGGEGYFKHVLPALGQPASYFALRNRHWQLAGLDSAYVNHNFTRPQIEWLGAQFDSPARSILLTHHHLFSPFRKRGDALEEWLDPYLKDERLFGWIWGHDHHLFEFADYRGMKCRCIGHGSLPYVPPDRRRRRHPAEVVRMETRPSPSDPRRGMNGFALLRFDGPRLEIEYIDEAGGRAWDERWE